MVYYSTRPTCDATRCNATGEMPFSDAIGVLRSSCVWVANAQWNSCCCCCCLSSSMFVVIALVFWGTHTSYGGEIAAHYGVINFDKTASRESLRVKRKPSCGFGRKYIIQMSLFCYIGWCNRDEMGNATYVHKHSRPRVENLLQNFVARSEKEVDYYTGFRLFLCVMWRPRPPNERTICACCCFTLRETAPPSPSFSCRCPVPMAQAAINSHSLPCGHRDDRPVLIIIIIILLRSC